MVSLLIFYRKKSYLLTMIIFIIWHNLTKHNHFSEALIFRMLAICTEKPPDERRKLVDRKVAIMSPGHFPISNLTETVLFVVQSISFQEEPIRLQSSKHSISEREKIFKSYSGRDVELEEGTYLEKN